jgi:hypothetical protein
MRIHPLSTLLAALILVACSTNPTVHSVAAPGFSAAGKSTFRILPVPAPGNGVTLGENDPMLVNSITNRALMNDVSQALIARGYRPAAAGTQADFDVAAYATANQALDINTFDYGYTWSGWPRQYTEVNTYEKGTVIVDLVDPNTHQLLWRGQGVAAVSENPQRFMDEMARVVNSVVSKLPPAGTR